MLGDWGIPGIPQIDITALDSERLAEPRRGWTRQPEVLERELRRLTAEGATYAEMESALGCSRTVIRAALDRLGLPRPKMASHTQMGPERVDWRPRDRSGRLRDPFTERLAELGARVEVRR